jgi:hypothetical protein
VIAALSLGACADPREGVEDPDDWFDPGSELDVEEFVAFTDEPYDFPSDPNDGIGALKSAVFPVPRTTGSDTLRFGPDDAAISTRGCRVESVNALPFDIEGVVTVHPRYYFKSSGCDWDSEEKFYGSFFIQDETGGVMVLGDTKVAHFDIGDRVRLRARGAKTGFDLDQIYTYDLLEIVERDVPIFYEETEEPFQCDRTAPIDWDACDVGRVKRVTGTVVVAMDTFGDFQIEGDNGAIWHVGLDSELNRRGVDYPVGTRITVTGPILYSFSTYTLVVMKKGQVEVH